MTQVRDPRSEATGEYWSWIEQGELRLQRCESCGVVRYPPASACQHCGAKDARWIVPDGVARLISWVRMTERAAQAIPPKWRELIPYMIGLVSLADDLDFLVPVLVNDVGAERLQPGAEVRIVIREVLGRQVPWACFDDAAANA